MRGFLADADAALKRGLGWAGLTADALAWVLASSSLKENILVVTDGSDTSEALGRGLRFFFEDSSQVWSFPADDTRPYDGFSSRMDGPVERCRTLFRHDQGQSGVVITSVQALMQRVPNATERARSLLYLRVGDEIERETLGRRLAARGYFSTDQVRQPGTFALRGDVLDLWSPVSSFPLRVDFFDDEIESLRRFDPKTRRPGKERAMARIFPVREERLDREAIARFRAQTQRWVAEQGRGHQLRRRTLEDAESGIRSSGIEAWLPAFVELQPAYEVFSDYRVIVVHPDDVRAAAADRSRQVLSRWAELEEDERPLAPPEARYSLEADIVPWLSTAHGVDEYARPGESIDLGARPVRGFSTKAGDLAPAIAALNALTEAGVAVGLVAEEGARSEALVEMAAHHGLVLQRADSPLSLPAETVSLLSGDLAHGFVAKDSGLAFVPASALFGRPRAPQRTGIHAFFDVSVSDVTQLREGDYVVHRRHGIGLYRGLTRLTIGGGEQDYVSLEYRDGDKMFLPVTRLELLSRYSPARSQPKVSLDRLGGTTWTARTRRVRDSVLQMADELLRVFAKRELASRPACVPVGDRYRLFEANFPFRETPDQLSAIEAVLADLASDKPMDRLVVGDVGFGKTEVAMRAAMRVVESGGQVGILCPTTVLAYQHYHSFKERFEGLDVRIEMLSRFCSPKDERRVLAEMKVGTVDIVIGTTKLLARSVSFDRLQLMVVDEEHRFGVRQKARMKKMRSSIDILALSATPIPRTLEMAFSGLREMSVIATPPADRLAVRTSVARMRKSRVRDAILRELERKGQVYFVHNRVADIEEVAEGLREWVPEASFGVAHGQMDNETLEGVLVDFIRGRFSVLVCSAIIESGIHLPNVNTMIINSADRFGLAQLYQLRGRVGRGSTRGNCLLLTPEAMSKEARKRVRVLVEAAQLGAGFEVASADLELRGGGNLVGAKQSGNIDSVGYEMWLELLNEAVREAKGELEREVIESELSVPVSGFIPESYVRDVPDRLGWYKRISSAKTRSDLQRVISELEGEKGELPPSVQDLAGLADLQLSCRSLGVLSCRLLKVRVVIHLHGSSPLTEEKLTPFLIARAKRTTYLSDRRELNFRFSPKEGANPIRLLKWLFVQLNRLL